MDKKLFLTSMRQFSFYPELVLLISFLFSILHLNLIQFNADMSMHLVRALEWTNFSPSSWKGPEVADFSFRLIGPFYYWLTGLFWSFTQSIEGLTFTNILFSYFCFYLLLKELKNNLSLSGLTTWAILFLLSPWLFISVRQIENSSLIDALSCLIFFVTLKYQSQRSKKWIWVASIIIFLSLQIHLATMAPALAFVSIVFFKSDKIRINTLFCSLWLILGFVFFPITQEIGFLISPASLLLVQIYENFISRRHVLKYAFLTLALIASLLGSSLIFKDHYIRLSSGRILTSDGLSSDMTLKLKKFIYSMSSSDGTDPFALIHGRAVNRMRREEMNSTQTEAYYGLYKSLFNREVTYDRSLVDKRPDSSWLFQLRSQREIAIGAATPFLMTEIKPQSLPQNTVIKYLNEKTQGLEKLRWNNSNLILPFAFLKHPEQTKIVRLEFQINSQTDKYLNLLIDPEKNYKLLQVKFNSKVQATLEHYPGNENQQSQYIYKIPDRIDQAKVVVELKVLTDEIPNYSRLDIFTSGYLLASEF